MGREEEIVCSLGLGRRETYSIKFVHYLMTLICAIFLSCSSAFSQEFNFTSISIKGNNRVENSTILNYTNIVVGKRTTAAQLNEAYRNLEASGLFETVELVPKGERLTIKVSEFPTINRVAFEGNIRLKDDVLADLISISPRRVFNPSIVEKDQKALIEAYVNSGRLAARVNPKIIRRSDNRVDVVFEIFEGGLIEIERLSFIGNKVFTDRKLRGVLNTKQAGLFRTLVKRDTFVESRLEYDKQLLTDFYKSRGYMDFEVNSINSEFSEERDGYFVTFNIREGGQFRIGTLKASTSLRGVDERQFSGAIKSRSNQVFSPINIENDIIRLERLANKKGIEFVKVTPKIRRDEAALKVNVDYVIERDKRAFLERIQIEGNTATLDRVIRRQFNIVEGDPFNFREIRASARRIRALGIFEDVEVESRKGTKQDQVVLDVVVTEAKTGSLSFGGSYSTSQGAGLLIEYSEKNFLGRGQALAFIVNSTTNAQVYSFNFKEPAFLYKDLSFSLGTEYRQSQPRNAQYESTNLKFRPEFSFPLSEEIRLAVNYKYKSENIEFPLDMEESIIKSEVGYQGTSGIGYSLSYDNRRSGLDPNAGILFKISQDYGLTGKTKNIVTTGVVAGEMKILGEEVTLRASLEGGIINYQKGKSRVTDRFMMGPEVVRGFELGGIGPREYTEKINYALGGEKYAALRFETGFPLGLPEEYGMSGGLFFDLGNLWDVPYEDSSKILYADGSWRQSIGLSLFWNTPIGPLRFNFAKALKKNQFDVQNNFEMTLATRRF